MAQPTVVPHEHLESLLAETSQNRRSREEYAQQRLKSLQRYRDIREQLEAAFTHVWCFGREENDANRKPDPAGFQAWASRFVCLGQRIKETGQEHVFRRRLNRAAQAGVPALDAAASLLLLACQEDRDVLARSLERVHGDADLRQFVVWLPYILDNLWMPDGGGEGPVRFNQPPDYISGEDLRKAGEAFGWRRLEVVHKGLRNLEKVLEGSQQDRADGSLPVDAVAASILEFGFRQPVVVDEQGVIIVGHTRYKAALKLGLEQVPVHVAVGLSPAQVKAYRLADNKTAELADWNQKALVQELADLQKMDCPIDQLGFTADELAQLFQGDPTDGLTDPDVVPEPPETAITKPGELWLLGTHRLLCGDAGNPADMDRLLAGAAMHLVNTDPPCNVRVEPRSNNAIAAGLSSFTGTTHHQVSTSLAIRARPGGPPRWR